MNEDNLTSLNLSKKLYEGGCTIQSDYYCVSVTTWLNNETQHYSKWVDENEKQTWVEESKEGPGIEIYPAYDILNDICVRYAKEFFGDRYGSCSVCGARKEAECPCVDNPEIYNSYNYFPMRLYCDIKSGKKQEAEDYLWEHCLFNPENKEK